MLKSINNHSANSTKAEKKSTSLIRNKITTSGTQKDTNEVDEPGNAEY
jgi:hypothetical protein